MRQIKINFLKSNEQNGFLSKLFQSIVKIYFLGMVEKFSEFDEYQLGKHGQKVKKEDIPIFVPENDEENDVREGEGRDERELAKRRFSVKRLIRLLHIKAPVYHVMAILGKKYVECHTVWNF